MSFRISNYHLCLGIFYQESPASAFSFLIPLIWLSTLFSNDQDCRFVLIVYSLA